MPSRLRELGWRVEIHDDHFDPTTKDPALLKAVAAHGWVFVTQDARIRYRRAEIEALRSAGLMVFVVVSGNLSGDATAEVLERARRRMERTVESQAAPFVCRVAKDGSLRMLA